MVDDFARMSNRDRVLAALRAEYGFVPTDLAQARYYMADVPFRDITVPRPDLVEQHRATRPPAAGPLSPSDIHGVVTMNALTGRVTLVDGYHRIARSAGPKMGGHGRYIVAVVDEPQPNG
jgi:hypothetical protein